MSDELYYDPYDFEIDEDPYPIWKRLRDEAPLYYNEKYDFYALSRFDDVERCSVDWRTYISGKGSVLEIIKSGIEMPPGNILFEDPPAHDMHRSLLSRVFTPKRIAELEPKVRAFCAQSLDPLVGSGGFDFGVLDVAPVTNNSSGWLVTGVIRNATFTPAGNVYKSTGVSGWTSPGNIFGVESVSIDRTVATTIYAGSFQLGPYA